MTTVTVIAIIAGYAVGRFLGWLSVGLVTGDWL